MFFLPENLIVKKYNKKKCDWKKIYHDNLQIKFESSLHSRLINHFKRNLLNDFNNNLEL